MSVRNTTSNKVFDTLAHLWLHYVPEYKSKSYRPFIASFKWDLRQAKQICALRPSRGEKRIAAYVIPGELERNHRASRAIRFGHKKAGHNGIHTQERADFCLVGGAFDKGHLTVFYRSLELVGGLPFDVAIYAHVEEALGQIKRVTIMSPQAHVLALRRDNNDTYERVSEYMRRATR